MGRRHARSSPPVAPVASASRITSAPRYAFAEAIRGSSDSTGSPLSMRGSWGLARTISATSSPSTTATGTSPSPIVWASRRTTRAAASGLAAPMFVTIRMPFRRHVGQHHPEAIHQVGGVSLVGVFQAREVFPRDSSLGETLEYQIVDIAPFGEFEGRFKSVVRETGARTNANAV